MVGVDLTSVSRVKDANKGGKLENKILSTAEKEYLETKNNQPNLTGFSPRDYTLAGFWAGKEAVLKAFGVGVLNGVKLNEIEILHAENGAPYVVINTKNCKIVDKSDYKSINISISHDAGLAFAVAIIT